jgi:hypothetical protein
MRALWLYRASQSVSSATLKWKEYVFWFSFCRSFWNVFCFVLWFWSLSSPRPLDCFVNNDVLEVTHELYRGVFQLHMGCNYFELHMCCNWDLSSYTCVADVFQLRLFESHISCNWNFALLHIGCNWFFSVGHKLQVKFHLLHMGRNWKKFSCT